MVRENTAAFALFSVAFLKAACRSLVRRFTAATASGHFSLRRQNLQNHVDLINTLHTLCGFSVMF